MSVDRALLFAALAAGLLATALFESRIAELTHEVGAIEALCRLCRRHH